MILGLDVSKLVPLPDSFSFEKKDWILWLTQYNKYRVASGLCAKTEREQINKLLLHMGEQVYAVLDILQKKKTDFNTFDEIVMCFHNFYLRKINVVQERAKFNLRIQNEHESAYEYIASVIHLAKTCNFGELQDELVRDRIVVGIRNKKLSEKLQLDEYLTLEKVIKAVAQSEDIHLQIKHPRSDSVQTKID